ncbi:MAG: hypothetical protein L0H93_07855 [Nocardioides sp.]|nr:hypothetical protein [Nocardioides sp.]
MTTHLSPTPDGFFGVDDDRKARAETRARDAGLEPCTVCGRGVKPDSGWVVEVVDGGAHIAAPGQPVDRDDSGYMGAWVLGSECAKRVPVAFRAKWSGWGEVQ